MEPMNLDDVKRVFTALHSGNITKPDGYCEAEVLVRRILDETPDAIEPFNSLEEMIEYAREALAANCAFGDVRIPFTIQCSCRRPNVR